MNDHITAKERLSALENKLDAFVFIGPLIMIVFALLALIQITN